MKVTLKISRFTPEEDRAPRLEPFAVTVTENQTMLDALLLAWQQDPGLSFRRSCRSAICGSCAMRINGQPALACQTLVRDAVSGEETVTLEPLSHFRQIKDLVVDLEPLFESLKAVVPWLVLRRGYSGRMEPETARKLENPAACILCGICHGDLEGAGNPRPAAVVKALRLAQDPRDALAEHRLRLLQLPAEVLKLFIERLPRHCPKGIEISGDILQAARDI